MRSVATGAVATARGAIKRRTAATDTRDAIGRPATPVSYAGVTLNNSTGGYSIPAFEIGLAA